MQENGKARRLGAWAHLAARGGERSNTRSVRHSADWLSREKCRSETARADAIAVSAMMKLEASFRERVWRGSEALCSDGGEEDGELGASR